MALKSAYNYVRENIDSNFDKYVADNVSYGCEEDIEDIKRWISEEGEDAQVALYYAQHEVRTYSTTLISMLKEWTSHMTTILLQL